MLCCAPVKAPRSWPNSWLSRSVSLIAEALNAMNGWPARAEGIVNGVSEQSFACAGLAKQNYWNVRFRGQRCNCRQRAMA